MIRCLPPLAAVSLLSCAPIDQPIDDNWIDPTAEGAICAEHMRADFNRLRSSNWKTSFEMPDNADWRKFWFLDGERAHVSYQDNVLELAAGPIVGDDADHAVLWTKDAFKGDVLIEYEWTKKDDAKGLVNILYIQATGEPSVGYAEDIDTWSEERNIPTMSLYFRRMNTLHISYSATRRDERIGAYDYVRARRYDPDKRQRLAGSDMKPDYFRSGLFLERDVPHSVVAIKHQNDLYFDVKAGANSCLFHWRLDQAGPITTGRIGLRHMYSRASSYRGFKVSTLQD